MDLANFVGVKNGKHPCDAFVANGIVLVKGLYTTDYSLYSIPLTELYIDDLREYFLRLDSTGRFSQSINSTSGGRKRVMTV